MFMLSLTECILQHAISTRWSSV